MKYKALGCHVFAGGFTMGVREVMDVDAQLEVHALGKKTVESMGLEFVRRDDWKGWLDRPDLYRDAHFLFGNPRCTGFSCVTAGYDEDAHGAWSKPTRDVHELCNFGVEADIPVICWESVQQAYSVGRELLDYLRDDVFYPRGYRILHLFLNAASWGNAQHRKRYFFLAYKGDHPFNVIPPVIPEHHTTVGDVIMRDGMLTTKTRGLKRKDMGGDPDSWCIRVPEEMKLMKCMPQGWDLHKMAKRRLSTIDSLAPRIANQWYCRTSDMPFSMHCIQRLHPEYYCPVISGSCSRYIHPTFARTLTLRELSRLMGWPDEVIPQGPDPFAELGKGIVPSVGKWLTQQVAYYLDDIWKVDWESTYDEVDGAWKGRSFTNDPIPPLEKVIDMTRYCPQKPSTEVME